MAVRVTVDMYSGRPNPVVVVEGPEADELLARVTPRGKAEGEYDPRTESVLGYRGVIVEQLDKPVGRKLPARFRVVNGAVVTPRGLQRPADEGFEDFVCGSTGPFRRLPAPQDWFDIVRTRIVERRTLTLTVRPTLKWPTRTTCQCAPLYEPDWWNDGGSREWDNNCYNYATNYRTDTFAQPGEAAGAKYTSLTCASVRPAAIADSLVDAPSNNNTCPGEGHLVALVIDPGNDYHWYRKGRNGLWTHKPGHTPVTNLDNSGNTITDPRTADRGGYTVFCTFMVVMHGHVKIT